MVAVPAETPLMAPVVLPIVATDRSLLLHLPPVVASPNVTENPAQTVGAPVIAATTGNALTVTLVVRTQPVGSA